MTDADRHASLAATHETRLKALLAGDLETLKTVVGEDMVFVSSFGGTSSRADVVAGFIAGTMQILRMDASDISTRIYGRGFPICGCCPMVAEPNQRFQAFCASSLVHWVRCGQKRR